MNNPFKAILNIFHKSEAAKEEIVKKYYADSIIFDQYGSILLLQRSFNDDFQAGKWCLPGGKIEQGESPDNAAERELMEETGLMLSLTFIEKINKSECEINYYVGFINGSPLLFLDNEEHYRYEFVSMDELDNYDLILDLKDRLQSIDFSQMTINNIEGLSEDEKILKDVTSVKIKKAFDRDEISDEDYFKYCSINEAVNNIRKGFDNDLISDEDYFSYMEKAKRYEFVRVVRDGKSFFEYLDIIKSSKKQDIKNDESNIDNLTDIELKQFAKEASESDLQSCISNSGNEKMRKIAHKELERRQKEEAVPEKDE